ncbi:MAG: methyltransferase domain-containing protein [Anaerolineales bacterium]|nr:MAG: methyltransferase domain-containing protein [Anaerolineales bacterium]
MNNRPLLIQNRKAKDFLFPQISSLPYFRGLLRAVEASYYQDLPLPSPVYDLGCGDGHFASLTFANKLDVGLDPWHKPIHEAKRYGAYRSLVEADGASAPFPSDYFSSGLSNSVLEHIPHIADVLKETARILKPNAPFYFCVPNPKHFHALSLTRVFGKPYENWFRKISRVHHADEPHVWEQRLGRAGFKLERWWHYFPPASTRVLEWGHYFGLPSLISRVLTGKWILSPTKWNLWLTERYVRKYASTAAAEDGTYTFYVAVKK